MIVYAYKMYWSYKTKQFLYSLIWMETMLLNNKKVNLRAWELLNILALHYANYPCVRYKSQQ